VRRTAQSRVVVGWTDVWSDGQYRLRARQPLVLPREKAS
jgi:hypothetical protein